MGRKKKNRDLTKEEEHDLRVEVYDRFAAYVRKHIAVGVNKTIECEPFSSLKPAGLMDFEVELRFVGRDRDSEIGDLVRKFCPGAYLEVKDNTTERGSTYVAVLPWRPTNQETDEEEEEEDSSKKRQDLYQQPSQGKLTLYLMLLVAALVAAFFLTTTQDWLTVYGRILPSITKK